MSSLANLLKPYNSEQFLEKNWTSKAIEIKNPGEKQFTDLFSWQKLNYLLNFHEFKYPELRLALDGKVQEASANENIIKLCKEGATLIINKVNKLIPEVATLAAEIQYEIGYGTQVNAYCSWPGKQGFSSHYDTHEVFILQVEGKKEWKVFPETLKYPLVEQKSASLTPPDTEPYLSCILEAGDVLYIPRGHWHYALALNVPSLHLTLGVHSKTGIDFLEWMVSQLREQEEWRESLPLRFEKEPVEKHIESLIENLDKYLYHHNIAENYINHLDSLGKPVANYSLPQQAGFNIFFLGKETSFKIPQLQRVKIYPLADGSEGCRIIFAGKEVSMKGLDCSFVEKLFAAEFFTGSDVIRWLPDFDWELDIVPFLNCLVMEGIIFVETSSIYNPESL